MSKQGLLMSKQVCLEQRQASHPEMIQRLELGTLVTGVSVRGTAIEATSSLVVSSPVMSSLIVSSLSVSCCVEVVGVSPKE